MKAATIEIKELSFSYANGKEKVLDTVSFNIEQGEFVLLCGESGCGKSTLMRHMKKQLLPAGKRSGGIFYGGVEIGALDEYTSVCDIGYVMQNPDNQIVTDKVWHELAFGLESIGMPQQKIRQRVAEICGYFGINELYHKKTSELSGGQKQLLNLASVMVTNPRVLILDEPTGQLDPTSASEFLQRLYKLNADMGVTVILAEHRLEEIFPLVGKVAVLDNGNLLSYGNPRETFLALRGHNMELGLPTPLRVYNRLKVDCIPPLSVKEGQGFLDDNFPALSADLSCKEEKYPVKDPVMVLKGGYFRYSKDGKDVLNGLNLTAYRGEILCMLGGNGAGKTTALHILSGLLKPHRGGIRVLGKRLRDYKNGSLYRENVSYLPQNPQTVFTSETALAELEDVCLMMGADISTGLKQAEELGLTPLLGRHPYDLSGGEQQKLALCKTLLFNPKILLLDEPTKGLDAQSKKVLGGILQGLSAKERTVIIVTHDVEFAAEYGSRCALLFDGQLLSTSSPRSFFEGNRFYTTAANKMARHKIKGVLTAEDILSVIEVKV